MSTKTHNHRSWAWWLSLVYKVSFQAGQGYIGRSCLFKKEVRQNKPQESPICSMSSV